jgi:hypothetical protein
VKTADLALICHERGARLKAQEAGRIAEVLDAGIKMTVPAGLIVHARRDGARIAQVIVVAWGSDPLLHAVILQV